MLYFKKPSGDVFAFASEGERKDWGSPELVHMTAGEIAQHLAAIPPQATPAEQIDVLERQYMLPRPVRDVLLPLMEKEAAALGVSKAQLRIVNAGYRRVKELDEQIAALRAQL